MDTDSSSLVDLAFVSVVGVVDSQGTFQSPGSSGPKEKKKKVTSLKIKLSFQPASWPNRPQTFNRLGALLMARTLDKEPTFQTVKVMPMHTPPVGSVKSTDLSSSRSTDLSLFHSLPTDQLPQICLVPNPPAVQIQVASKSTTDRPQKVDRPRTTDLNGTDSTAPQRQATRKSTSELTEY